MVKVEYDEKADAMYIWLRKTRCDLSEELAENVVLDLDKDGRIIGNSSFGRLEESGKGTVRQNIAY